MLTSSAIIFGQYIVMILKIVSPSGSICDYGFGDRRQAMAMYLKRAVNKLSANYL